MIQQNLGINNVTDSDFSYPKMPKDTREFFGLNSYSSSLRTSLHYQVYFQNSTLLDYHNTYLGKYSHLSNKREVTLTDFEKKIHPPRLLVSQIFSTLHSSFIAIMYQFFPRLLMLQFLHPSKFIPNSTAIREMRVSTSTLHITMRYLFIM